MSGTTTAPTTTPARRRIRGPAGMVGLAALVGFAILTTLVVSRDGAPFAIDDTLLTWSTGHRPGAAVSLAGLVTATGTGPIAYALAALAGVIAGRTARQRAVAAAAALLCLAAGQGVRYAVRDVAARPRPDVRDWATHASGYAFPSGHTATSAVIAGLLITAVLTRRSRGRAYFAATAACWAAAVGLSRVYLGVHWFSDVIGGWLFAASWLALCLCLAARWLPRPAAAGPPAPQPQPQAQEHGRADEGR
ncbi:phosphatase PAP2 family protein [Streptomyces sp. NPDC002574]|uniref:phosphatase PAP2 family protein n=1 Tax=Streptomyces sp. NPDC002574 TaxID=3364652 RepID=UPI003674AA5B